MTMPNRADQRGDERPTTIHAAVAPHDLLMVADSTGEFRFLNRAARNLLRPAGDWSGMRIQDAYVTEERDRVQREILAIAAKSGRWSGTATLLGADGSTMRVRQVVEAVRDGYDIKRFSIVSRDVRRAFELTDRRSMSTLRAPADGSRGRHVREQLAAALFRAGEDCSTVAVLVVAIDDFAAISEAFGGETADRLSSELLERIESQLRTRDDAHREEHNLFHIVLEGARGADDALAIGRRIVASISEPFVMHAGELMVTAKIGIALPLRPSDLAEDLLRDAEAALARVQGGAGSKIELSDRSIDTGTAAVASGSASKVSDPGRANPHFDVVYQPVVGLDTGTTVGLEALLGRRRADTANPTLHDVLGPEAALQVPLNTWLLLTACRQLAQWQRDIPSAAAIQLSVSVSHHARLEPSFVDEIARIIRETGIDPAQLCLEISESEIAEYSDVVMRSVGALRTLGISLSIDDFGTAGSSVRSLGRLPFNSVKVDHSLVDGLGHDSEHPTVLEEVLQIGHKLGMTVVARGVDTSEQLASLTALGCDAGQGHYFANPQPAGVVTALLNRPLCWRPRGGSRLAS